MEIQSSVVGLACFRLRLSSIRRELGDETWALKMYISVKGNFLLE